MPAGVASVAAGVPGMPALALPGWAALKAVNEPVAEARR
jgi:hypothetical protein